MSTRPRVTTPNGRSVTTPKGGGNIPVVDACSWTVTHHWAVRPDLATWGADQPWTTTTADIVDVNYNGCTLWEATWIRDAPRHGIVRTLYELEAAGEPLFVDCHLYDFVDALTPQGVTLWVSARPGRKAKEGPLWWVDTDNEPCAALMPVLYRP